MIAYDVSDFEDVVTAFKAGKYTEIPKPVQKTIVYTNYMYCENLKHKLENNSIYRKILAEKLGIHTDLLKAVGQLESKPFDQDETLHFEPNRKPKTLIYPEHEQLVYTSPWAARVR